MSETLSKSDLLGGKVSTKEIMAALGFKSPKPVMSLIRRLNVPYVVIDRLPHVDPVVFRAAIDREMANTAPRGRGRPAGKKAA